VWRYEKSRLETLIAEGKIWWGKDGAGFPRLKNYISEVANGVVPSTWWDREFARDNHTAKKTFRKIFDNVEDDFSTPKPPILIERII
jgi:adenine-specific DNA-methyltransferase